MLTVDAAQPRRYQRDDAHHKDADGRKLDDKIQHASAGLAAAAGMTGAAGGLALLAGAA
jgi:hypothetical protein